jgi:hypothetical protein
MARLDGKVVGRSTARAGQEFRENDNVHNI